MKRINYFKIVWDFLIALTFALLFNPRFLSGISFHETAGIAIGAGIITHVLLNSRWIKNVTAKIFDSKLPGKTRFSYFLNLLLLIVMATTIITGIMISRYLFPNISAGNPRSIRQIHSLASYLTLGIVGVHVGVHWQWVMSVIKKVFVLKGGKPRISGIVSAVVLLGLLIGGYQWYSKSASNTAAGFGQPPFARNGQGFNGGQGDGNGQSPGPGFTNAKGNNGDGNNDFRGRGSGDFGDRHNRDGGFRGRGGRSPLTEILTNFGIMAVIIIPTYYLDKRLFSKKRAKKQNIV